MEDMPYNQLIPHFTVKVIEAVKKNDTARAEKYCFTLFCEQGRNEMLGKEDDLNLVNVALANLATSDTAKEVYETTKQTYQRYVSRLAA